MKGHRLISATAGIKNNSLSVLLDYMDSYSFPLEKVDILKKVSWFQVSKRVLPNSQTII